MSFFIRFCLIAAFHLGLFALPVQVFAVQPTGLLVKKSNKILSVQEKYEDALLSMEKGHYKIAAERFLDTYLYAPAGDLGRKCMLLESYCLYKGYAYKDALTTLDEFLEFYPFGPDTDYAHYLKLLCFWQQVGSSASCTLSATRALRECEILLNEFPEGRYFNQAKARKAKLELALLDSTVREVCSNLRRKNPVAAILSCQAALKEAERLKAADRTQELLFRAVESHIMLGIPADEYAQRLQSKYPDSRWAKLLN